MDKKYIELFKELAHSTAISAEQVMDYDKAKNDNTGYQTAENMRNDFATLYDKMNSENFDGKLTRAEYARLAVGSYIIINQIQDRITALKNAITGYQTDIVPKLDKVIAAESDEAAQVIAEQEFIIKIKE